MLIDAVIAGVDLAVGSRVLGHCEKGAMKWHQRMGNGYLAKLIRFLWRCNISDFGSIRAIRYDVLMDLRMQDGSYGWNVEMLLKVLMRGYTMREFPVSYFRQIGQSKISGTVSGSVKAGCVMIYTIVKWTLLSRFCEKRSTL